MVRKRKPKSIEEFAEAADLPISPKQNTPNNDLDQAEQPKSKVKSMGVSFDYEDYLLLKKAAKSSNRSMKAFIRHAVKKLAEEELGN